MLPSTIVALIASSFLLGGIMASGKREKSLTPLQRAVKEQIESGGWDWYAAEEIAENLDTSAAKVRKAIAERPDVFIQARRTDPNGRALYATRKHYQRTHNIVERVFDTLSSATSSTAVTELDEDVDFHFD